MALKVWTAGERLLASELNDNFAFIRGASGGGVNKVFYENDQNVTDNYTITSGSNAMTAGPIEIDDGVTVEIPSGSVWTVV